MRIFLLFMLVWFGAATPLYALPVSVKVMVIDENGAAIEKASIQLESFATSPSRFAIAETATDGTVSFDIESSRVHPRVVGRILVLKQGFALAGSNLLADKPLKIVLKKASILRGMVLDASKKPVKDAKISLLGLQTELQANSTPEIFPDSLLFSTAAPILCNGPLKAKMETMSGEDGTWQLDNLPSGVEVYVSIIASGFAAENVSSEGGQTLQTSLRTGASIRGKLIGLDGKPLSDVNVYARSIKLRQGTFSYAESRTRPDGSFDLDGLEVGTFNVMFGLEGDKGFLVPAIEDVTVEVGDAKVLSEAHAVEGIFIGGQVTEKGGKPLEGVTIGTYKGVGPQSNAEVNSTVSDEKGQWKLRTLPGKSEVYIQDRPHGFIYGQQKKILEIGTQGDLNINFELERAPKITGRFVDEVGKGVAAKLVVKQRFNQVTFNEFPVTSDETGKFEFFIFPIQIGDEVEFEAHSYDFTPVTEWDVVDNPKRTLSTTEPIEIKLVKVKLRRFEARVYDEGDVALEGVTVNMCIWSGTGDYRTGEYYDLVSDKDGTIKLEGIRSGQTVEIISVDKAGYSLISELSVIQKDEFIWGSDIIMKNVMANKPL